MPEPKLRYHLKQFPIESLAQWMPKDFAWQGRLNADLQLDLPASGPNGRILVDASGGTLRIRNKDRDDEQWLDLPYQTLTLDSRLTPKRIDTHLHFAGAKLCDQNRRATCRGKVCQYVLWSVVAGTFKTKANTKQ